jgi:hypothetical protein
MRLRSSRVLVASRVRASPARSLRPTRKQARTLYLDGRPLVHCAGRAAVPEPAHRGSLVQSGEVRVTAREVVSASTTRGSASASARRCRRLPASSRRSYRLSDAVMSFRLDETTALPADAKASSPTIRRPQASPLDLNRQLDQVAARRRGRG